jgi:type IV pilus assembly protein PilC
MAIFLYKASNSQGVIIEGELKVDNREMLLSLLRRKKLTLISAKKAPIQLNIKIGTGIKSEDIARFTRQFAAMTSAGLPLLQTLDILMTQSENPFFKEVLKQVVGKITGGGSLFEALSMHPKVFSQLYCFMVQAGEAGGILDDILVRLADYQEASERLKRKIKGAMTYPVIILIVAAAVVSILLVFVVPIFAGMFEQNGAELPMPTVVVMQISEFLQANILYMLGAMLLGFIAFKKYRGTKKGLYNTDKILLKLPAFGNLAKKSAISRFSQTLGTLLDAGVPIIDALQVTAKTSGNMVLELGIGKVIESISGGQNISDPLAETGIFPPMVIQMIGVGEKTGDLPTMLEKIAGFYKEEVDAAVDNLTAMIEPLIIVFLGVVIGGIMVAMYMPMFGLADTVG